MPPTTTVADQPTVAPRLSRPAVDPTNWSMSQIVDGGELTWQLDVESDIKPMKVVTIDGTVFVLGSSTEAGGLRVWSTDDGMEFVDHGSSLPEGSQVAAVGDSGDALLVATPSTETQPPMLWRSSDGTDWSSRELPFDTDNPFLRFRPQALGGTPDLTVIAGYTTLEAEDFLTDRLMATAYPQFDDQVVDLNWTANQDEVLIEVTVPPGLRLARFTGTEIGLTEAETMWLTSPTGQRANLGVEVLALPTGGEWQTSTLSEVIRAEEIFGTPGGQVLLAGFTPAITPTGDSRSVHRTFEGLTWELVGSPERPLSGVKWGTRMIGPAATGDQGMLISDDGLDWTRNGIEFRFPSNPRFAITHVATGPVGVVASAESKEWPTAQSPDLGVAQIERDDLTVGLEFSISNSDLKARVSAITIRREADIGTASQPVVYPVPGNAERDDLVIDVASKTVTFKDEQGVPWLDLGFTELDDLLRQANEFRNLLEMTHSQALAHSIDADSWMLRDITDLVGDGQLAGIGQPGDRAIAVLTDSDGFGIWSAQLQGP